MRKILVYLPFLLLSICACSSNEDENLLPEEKSDAQFFEYSKTNDEFKEFVINYLKMEDDSIPFTAEFVRTYGIPKWDISIEHIASNTGVLVVPITDKNANKINALYYFVLGEETFDYYIFMNDKEDVAYETMKRFIQVFETKLGIEISNKEFRVKLVEKQINDNSTTKARRNESVSCFDEYAGSLENPYMYYKGTHCTPGTPDMEWYSNRDNSVNRDKINLPDPIRGNGGSTGNTDPGAEPLPIVDDEILHQNERTNCVYSVIKDHYIYKELIMNLRRYSSNNKLVWEIVDSLSANGRCRYQSASNTITIMLNRHYINTADCPVLLARTIVHETIHAYLFNDKPSNGLGNEFFDGFNAWFTKKYKDSWDVKKNGTIHHNLMHKYYVSWMGEILYDFDNHRFSRDHYISLAYQGLENTEAYRNNPDKERIEKLQKEVQFAQKNEDDCF